MHLPTILLALFTLYTTATSNNQTTINFDSIPTTSGLAPVPSAYNHLTFTSYSILPPRSPALSGKISPHDLNCAVSSPNALLGSRPCEECTGASFEIANATAMKEGGLQPHFTLHSFAIKPMDAPAPGTLINVKGYRVQQSKGIWKGQVEEEEDELSWHVEFPSGFHDMFEVRMEKFSGLVWEGVRKVVIEADFGYAELDWEFCVDDLVVQFFEVEGDRDGGVDQVVLREV